jgi:hypothetical protein
MATRRNDDLGFMKGARGIDGNDGSKFTVADQSDMDAQFGRSYAHTGQLTKAKFASNDCDYSESADTAIYSSKTAKSAIPNFKPYDKYDGFSETGLKRFKK